MQRIVLIGMILFIQPAFGQTRVIDSLLGVIHNTTDNTHKFDAIYMLSYQNYNPDSVLPYLRQAAELVTANPDSRRADQLTYSWALYLVRVNKTDSALQLADQLIRKYRNLKGGENDYLTYLFFKSKVLDRAGEYSRSLSQLTEVVETAESMKDTLVMIQARTGIGWVQMEMGQYREALQWLYLALHTSGNRKFYTNYGALYSNLASAYTALGKQDSAVKYINIAINDARENENMLFLATALSMQARIFINGGQPQLAEQPLHEVVDIRKKINDPFYTVFDMASLASYYAANNQPEKGIRLCKEGIAISEREKLSSQLLMIYQALAENYKAAGNSRLYGETLEYIIALKDSFNNISSSKQLAEAQAKFDVQRREKTIVEQKLSLTRKNYWLYGSAIVGVMAAVITWLGFMFYRRRQQQRTQIALEKQKQEAAIAVRDAEEQERKRIAADLHDSLGVYAASMSSNLNYLQVKENDERSATAFTELRDNSNSIIAQLNDTIWVLKKELLSLTAVSDRIKVVVQRLGRSYPDILVEVEEAIEQDVQMPASQAFHLYRILQEGINNALRHSGGTRVLVRFESNIGWKVYVQDNGKGMEAATYGGNGLENLRNRAREAGWAIEWQQREGGGTRLLVFPTTN